MLGRKKADSELEQKLNKLKRFGFEEMGNFNSEDVFIIGYPKSGNTLMQFLIAFLVYGVRKDSPLPLINSCVTEFYNNPFYYRYNKRHFFKSHELPAEEYKNVIYIVRDGREAVRSYYYMAKNLGETISLENLYKSGGKTFVGTWENHLRQWTENKFNANILFVKFEDLLSSKENEI
ncbi:MAG TPA: hypothetical protein DCS66_12820, partial [Flavobacteriaceae bacterium]|nr:hypothetical protein [Flavobacteriaceae bacterium]